MVLSVGLAVRGSRSPLPSRIASVVVPSPAPGVPQPPGPGEAVDGGLGIGLGTHPDETAAARRQPVSMTTTNHIHTSGIEATEELIEVTGGGLRIVEIGVVILLGLLVCPPLLILAVVVAVPVIAVSALVAAVVAAVAVPTLLVRRVRAHHRRHGSTLFLHRVLRR
jgi:hypothetical protein